jgi:hypothetical protein
VFGLAGHRAGMAADAFSLVDDKGVFCHMQYSL